MLFSLTSTPQTPRLADLLLLVLVLFEGLRAALERLSHQRLSCNLPAIESVHLLLQLPSFLLQSLLFLLVHPFELLKPLVELDTTGRVRQSVKGLNGSNNSKNWFRETSILTSFSFSFSSASVSFTLLTNICLISSSLRCRSKRNSFLFAS